MRFCVGLLLRPIAGNEVSMYMVRWLERVVVCGVPVAADYLLDIVACADISIDFMYVIFRRGIALLDLSTLTASNSH